MSCESSWRSDLKHWRFQFSSCFKLPNIAKWHLHITVKGNFQSHMLNVPWGGKIHNVLTGRCRATAVDCGEETHRPYLLFVCAGSNKTDRYYKTLSAHDMSVLYRLVYVNNSLAMLYFGGHLCQVNVLKMMFRVHQNGHDFLIAVEINSLTATCLLVVCFCIYIFFIWHVLFVFKIEPKLQFGVSYELLIFTVNMADLFSD